ncbi:MAG: hypothetical protein IJO63_05675 [Bacilli bacterium]|nr:hypothetical protein [Bacilli bacterium]
MEFKVLINLYIPEAEKTYELYIPVNKTIYEVLQLIMQIVEEKLPGVQIDNPNLYNRRKNILYEKGLIVRNTDIRNGTELILY